jgi:primary-amine oxidase
MRFRPALFGFGLPAMLMLIAGAFGQQRPEDIRKEAATQPSQPVAAGKTKTIEQSFPPNGIMETAWKVEWETVRRHGLVIKNAWFKRGPEHDWLQVLGDTRVAELFVPYHRGSPRFWDVTQYQFELTRVSAADAGPFGKLHISNNGSVTIPCVVEELKDRGVIWKDNFGVRRGHTLLLWACIDAANYRYIIEYGFQDDGCITFRVGATGHNLGGSEFEPHMHNTYWRIDVNLDGPDHNSVLVMERDEPLESGKLKADIRHVPFNDGREGGIDWDSNKFSMVRIVNTQKKNVRDKFYSYDLMPARMGNSRHFGDKEDCTLHDFWVTRANPKEMTYRDIQKYCNDELIEDTDVVLWYGVPLFHEPRSEDGAFINGRFVGCTHVAWSSFTLKPSNIHDRTPLYPYQEVIDKMSSKLPIKGKKGNDKDKDK